MHQAYSDYIEANQTYVFAGYYPGGEDQFALGLLGSTPAPISIDYFQYMVMK